MNFGDLQAEQLVEAVRLVAREEILPRFRSLSSGDVKSKAREDDLVTVADIRSEERLTEALARICPNAAVVGEEAVAADASVVTRIDDAELSVIIDPIDGTWNYAKGLGLFGVIVAVVAKGETIWGLLYDPIGDDWVVAERGAGARHIYHDGSEKPLSLSHEAVDPANMVGFVGFNLYKGDEKQRLLSNVGQFGRVGVYRCAAHEYRLMAHGDGDFMLTPMINPWDHAAGCLAVREAGGVARFLDGQDYQPTRREGRLLVAGSEQVWAETSQVFRNL